MNGKNIARKFPVFSWNSKIGPNAIALNFSRSGGDHCDDSCALKKSGVCYAMASQKIYGSLYAKLERHERIGFKRVLDYAFNIMLEAAYYSKKNDFADLRFFRFSTHGTTPSREFTLSEANTLRQLGQWSRKRGIEIHFPVETIEKYRRVLDCGIQPRLSFQDRISDAINSPLCSSVTAGRRGQSKVERIDEAKKIAVRAREAGKRAVICPAIVSSFRRRKGKVTCDMCKLCASGKVDMVIYPMH